MIVIWSNNINIVKLIQNYFDSVWYLAIKSVDRFKQDKWQFDYIFISIKLGFVYKIIF